MPEETLAAILAEARDKYAVHDCNECDFRKSCDERFDNDECKSTRQSISLAFGIEDGYFTKLLDRIEAAAEREREAAQSARDTRDAMDYAATATRPFVGVDLAKDEPTHTYVEIAPGNSAAMRDLLEKIRREYGWGRIGCRTCVSSEADVERVSDLFEKQIDAALAAPARNCDRFRTPKDALDVFIREKGITSADVDSMNLRDFFDWLFEKAEGTEVSP